MKNFKLLALFGLMFFTTCRLFAQDPQQAKEPDFVDIAEKQADALMKMLNLSDAQVFLVDSILQHDLPLYDEAITNVKKSGATTQQPYQAVADKWMNQIDCAYQKIFDEKQWEKYMKSSYGKEKKKRDKRLNHE